MPKWIDWLFRDRRSGRLVIGQAPNGLMLLFVATTIARAATRSRRRQGGVEAVFALAQVGSLGAWALDEALRGVNPFRRIGGAAVVALAPFRRMLRP